MTQLADQNINELIENFQLMDDWEDRYGYIIDLGKQLPPMADADKTDVSLVRGCQSMVWMVAEMAAGEGGSQVLRLTADSDAFIVRGLIAILFIAYDGQTPQGIDQIDSESIFKQLGLDQHLSPTRRNGLHAMVKRIHDLAHGGAG